MFSIIVSMIHDISALRPVFLTSSKDAEIIIIDAGYNEQTKEELKDFEHNYSKVTYAPSKKEGFLSSYNTGLSYAEGPWCFCIHDFCELKPDFFNRLAETIEVFTKLYENRFVMRPIDLEPNNNDTRWVSYIKYKQRYFHLPCMPLGSTGMRSFVPIVTCGVVIAHLDTWFLLNGFDERYDIGTGWWDNDLFDRFVIMRHPVILDQQLMTYRVQHKQNTTGKEDCKKLYDSTIDERNKSIRAPNPFDLKTIHGEMMKQKERHIIC